MVCTLCTADSRAIFNIVAQHSEHTADNAELESNSPVRNDARVMIEHFKTLHKHPLEM